MNRAILVIVLLLHGFVSAQVVGTKDVECFLDTITENYYLNCNDIGTGIDKSHILRKENNCYKIGLNNREIILKDTGLEDDPSYRKYVCIGKLSNYLCFQIYYYEMATILFINTCSGIDTEIYGNIYVSPNIKYLISASQISGYDPLPNNIQLWSIDDEKLHLITELNLNDWVPENIKWINDSTVVFEKTYNDNKKAWGKFSFVSL